MTNIWGFLNQTLTVSLVAAVLLVIKSLLQDKLSPRWQYGIWSILALRILVPAPCERMVFLPLGYWVEIWKSEVESHFQSAYASVYEPIELNAPVPFIISRPESIMDWIFVIYAAGIFICALRYLFSFLSLKWKLRKGEKCQLVACENVRAIKVQGLQTAFVCAGFKPVLVLPADKELDEKVILHECLHLKYHDEWQTIFWCVLKCFHWCNPFLWYVFARIENDMESLCDQRVLESLEGEARREYGMTLLQMANEKYARVPGTSSISNGGANIKRRIESIVRFKKYPKGMALASICIGVVFLLPVIVGTSLAYDPSVLNPINEKELRNGLALSRIHRCTTMAGTLDTYAKGLMHDDGIYIAIASPLDKQKELAEHMYGRVNDLDQMFLYDSGEELRYLTNHGYEIRNIEEVGEKEYTAVLVFQRYFYSEEEGGRDGILLIPVRIWYESSWVVEEFGERKSVTGSVLDLVYNENHKELFSVRAYQTTGETGTISIRMSNQAIIDNWEANEMSLLGLGTYSSTLKTDAVFDTIYLDEVGEYQYSETTDGKTPKTSYGVQIAGLESKEQAEEVPIEKLAGNSGGSSTGGGLTYGYSWQNRLIYDEETDDGNIMLGGGGSIMYDVAEFKASYPKYYLVRIYWDGEVVEELILE